MKATVKKFRAYIAANQYTRCFDMADGKTEKSAIAAVKRRNSPDWKDCFIWTVELQPTE